MTPNSIILSTAQLRQLVESSAKTGAAAIARTLQPKGDLVTQREAYRLFGEARVKRWLADGLLTTERTGTSVRSRRLYSREQLCAAEVAEQLQWAAWN